MPDLPAFRDALTATQKGLFTILGAIDHTFTRDETWRFLKLGEALERLFRTTLVLRVKLPALLAAEPRTDLPLYYTQWRTLLRTLSSLENYRRRYGARLVPQLVIAFLLFDPNSPRSLRYGVAALKECLEVIAGPGNLTAPGRLVGRLLADFCYDEEELMRRPDFAGRLRGIPCRYVSGHLHVDRKKREPSQSHAWIEFYAPGAGWVPFDPTHNCDVDERYVVVGHGRHYDDVPPNKGIYRGGAKEALRAGVLTEVTTGTAVSSLREKVRHIDLPVFPELPQRRMDRLTAAEEAIAQQQQ